MDRIAIIGAAGHAKVIINMIAQDDRYQVAGLIDKTLKPGEVVAGYSVLGNDADLAKLRETHKLAGMVVAVGDNALRGKLSEKLTDLCPGLPLVSVTHPSAVIADDVEIGEGTVVMAGAVINPACRIGRGCIVNTRAVLDHDSLMGDFSSIAPGSVTGGESRIGSYSAIGIGAVLKHGVCIGEHSVVGAGSTVLKDIAANKVAHGTPATEVRDRIAGEPYF